MTLQGVKEIAMVAAKKAAAVLGVFVGVLFVALGALTYWKKTNTKKEEVGDASVSVTNPKSDEDKSHADRIDSALDNLRKGE